MKIKYSSAIICVFLFIISGCEHENTRFIINNFENLLDGSNAYFNGSDLSGIKEGDSYRKEIASGSVTLVNYYRPDESGGSWTGFAVSSQTDTIEKTEVNLYSSISGQGAMSSPTYLVVSDSAEVILPCIETYQQPKSIMLNNSTFVYYHILEGSVSCRKFREGDWLKVIVTGLLGGEVTGEVEFYLADFRDGKLMLVRNWTRLNLRGLGNVDKIKFHFDSNYEDDACNHSLRYLCVDNLDVIVHESCSLLKEYDY